MTRLSRFKVDPEHMGWFINNFWNSFTLLDNKEDIKIFLRDLLTHTELKMLAKRLQIAKMLFEGKDYSTIKSYVKVTDQTVAKINNILNTKGNGFKKAVIQIQKLERDIEKKWEESGKVGNKYSSALFDEVVDLIGKSIKKNHRRKSAIKQ